jgi:hypothetical protein
VSLRSPTVSGALYFVCGLLLCAAVGANTLLGVPFSRLFGDPNSIAQAHPFTGALSVVGTFMWAAGGAICLFSAAVLRARGATGRLIGFLCASGVFTLWLLVDDQFQIHEDVAEARLGIDQRLFFFAYLGIVGVGLARYRTCILDSSYPLLLIALGFLGLSVLVDMTHAYVAPLAGGAATFLEDGCKLLGIAGWLGYYAQTCFLALGTAPTAAGVATPLR